MLWPFHCFYYEFRKSTIITLIRNIFPIGKNGVRFRDFMFGDILTSLTRPFSSIALAMCLFSCQECRLENTRLNCDRKSVAALVLILSPFIIRLFQCLNRFYYTKMAWPHLGNALKYCGGITYNLFSWIYSRNKPEYHYQFVIIGIIANSYMLFWDIYMDWNLARSFSFKNNFFLREIIVYPKWMYYWAIVINSILRFTWLTSLLEKQPLNEEAMVFILSLLEIYRRTQWSLFRIENENTNNPEKYRTTLDIPQLPLD
jgi:xenotropic and polytropic retrovirus receptor 1